MPIDEPSDLLYRLIVHELTHQFQFDIIPTGLIRRNMPLWVFEGMSDYMTGYWRPLDIMTVRDAAVSDIVPKMSEMQDYGGFSNPRLIYNLGHAAFEFMESKWGKEGVRAYVFALRRSVIGGSDDAYQEAFQVTPEEWENYKSKLKEAYLRMDKLFHENPVWNEASIGGALSIVIHTAYHLGEIRQALCVLK